MDVQLPDGTLIRDVPDGMSRADLVAKLKANGHDVSGLETPPAPSALDTVKSAVLDQPIPAMGGMSPRQTFNAGVGALRGAKDVIDTGAHGLAAGFDKVFGTSQAPQIRAADQAGNDQYNAAFGGNQDARAGRLFGQGAITAPIGGVLGKVAGPVIEAGGNALARVAPSAGEAVAQWAPKFANALRTNGFSTGAPAAPGLAGAASNLATRSLAGGIAGGAQVGAVDPEHAGTGALIGAVLPAALRGIGAAGEALAGPGLTPERQAAVDAARQAGFKLPPTEMNPNALNTIAEGLSGKIKTSQAASQKNQPVVNTLAAKALGIDPEQPITPQVLDGVRKTAGQAYEALKNTGTVTADDSFGKALDNIVAKYKGASADFPGLVKSEVPEMVDALRQKTFSASGAVDAIGVLRDTAKEAFAKQNTGLGKAAKSAADELESLMGRHLEATGADPALIKQFQDARATIAKTYTVGKALNQSTGDVSAASLASQKAKGKPLTNELNTIASAAQAFPKAMQTLPQNYNALSPLDFAVGALAKTAGVASGNMHLAIPLVRPAVRSAIMSSAGQNLAAQAPNINALAGPAVYRSLPRAGQRN